MMSMVAEPIVSLPERMCRALLAGALLFGLAGGGVAAEVEPPNPVPTPPSAKVETFLNLLADPDVQALLRRRDRQKVETPAEAAPPKTMAISLADRLQGIRAHLIALADATNSLPREAARAQSMLGSALAERGAWATALYFLAFVALGFGTEGLFRFGMRPFHRWLLHLTLETANERVRAVLARLIYGLGLVATFGLGSVGAFLLFDWPSVIKEVLLGYLIAFLFARVFAVAGRIMLAPGAARFRVVPMATPAANFLFRRWLVLGILIGFGGQTISLFSRFGLAPLAGELCLDGLGLLVLAMGLDVIWRAPRTGMTMETATGDGKPPLRHLPGVAIACSGALVAMWLLWMLQATEAFWLTGFAYGLPLAIMVAHRSVNHILRPAGSAVSPADAATLDVIIFERAVRSLIIVGAVLLLGRILHVDFTSLTMQDTLTTRLVRATASVVVVILAAEFLWRVIKALVDRKLAGNMLKLDASEDAGHAARLQTLLPILSNMLLVVIVVVSGMMVLAAFGVEIGPLIASAGVVGVAIGFGAQTLVKDIISGIFYLVDDAFRIGEYIQSGTYKGTVESFSLRSVKLRHQRGALYTVPFGILGAVQNQSRDWVVDKIVLNVPYGTDLERVRKLVKRIGETLSEDPEFGPDIINPLKMQGVVQFGDFAIQIQTKMMTKPGDVQFAARRRALLMINQAFAENGIGFAMPMVHVAEQGGSAAAAQKAFDMLRPVKVD